MAKTRRPDSLAAEAAFRARLIELGATLLEPDWLGRGQRHHVRCINGHDTYPTPGNVAKGHGICVACAGHDPVVAEAAFRASLTAIGATPLFEKYMGASRGHHVRCAAGHDCYPHPSQLRSGRGICKACVGQSPAAAEAFFRARVEELGGQLCYAEWRGTNSPHHVRCPAGHDCYPRPTSIRDGNGICRTCAGQNQAIVEAAFRARLTELGAEPLFDEWLGAHQPHRARCAYGHECWPYPSRTQQGGGICKTCAGQDSAASEARFRAKLEDLGALPLYEKWLGVGNPHHVQCLAGHECWPRPGGVLGGKGICRTCSGRDPESSERAFRDRLAELGAVPMYEKWLGVSRAHWIRCASGHDSYPRPDNVRTGQGICERCAGMLHTVFYVVEHASKPIVKFGISSLDGQGRLAKHRSRGYTILHLLATGLADGVAWETEGAVKSALALACETPVQGEEYFDTSCLALILDVADSWLQDGPLAA